jgi:hypothetical protein
MEGLRAQTNRPTNDQPGDAPTVEKGQIRQWLVLGTFPVKDAVAQFDSDPLGGEGSQQPSVGERIAEREWKLASVKPDDPDVFGEAGFPGSISCHWWASKNISGLCPFYLYSHKGGRARVVADHSWGLKAWLNGKGGVSCSGTSLWRSGVIPL